MRNPSRFLLSLSSAWALLVLSSGCSQSKPPEALTAEQVPATVESAFKDASPEAKSSAAEVIAAIQGNDEPKAILDLQALFARPDLTPEQRDVASRSMISLNERLRAAAAQGDKNAAQALETYRARK